MTAIRRGRVRRFVIGGGVRRVLSDGNLAARAQMPFWLQMVGTGLTATFAAHLGAVLKQARWPAIPCVNIYSHVLVQEFAVEGGHLRVRRLRAWGRVGPGCCGASARRAGLCESGSASDTRCALARWPRVVGTGRRVSGRFYRWQNHRLLSGNGPPSAARRWQRRIDREYRERFPERA